MVVTRFWATSNPLWLGWQTQKKKDWNDIGLEKIFRGSSYGLKPSAVKWLERELDDCSEYWIDIKLNPFYLEN